MTTNVFNANLAWVVLDFIEKHPQQWNQNMWVTSLQDLGLDTLEEDKSCGTAFCFAGHALNMSGWKPIEINKDSHGRPVFDWTTMCSPEGESAYVGGAAADLLGLSTKRADALFAEDNSLDDLRRLVHEYTNNLESSDIIADEEDDW